MNSPCKNCQDRYIDIATGHNCHTDCEKYQEFAKYKEEERKRRALESQSNYYVKGNKKK